MEVGLLSKDRFITNDDNVTIRLNRKNISSIRTGLGSTIVNKVTEAGEDFFRYLKNLGLSDERNMIILSSRDFYNYDRNKLDKVMTLVNRKKLNLIKHLDLFLLALVRILPQNAHFIGCFADHRAFKGKAGSLYRFSGLFNRFNNFLDCSADNYLDKNDVSEIMERSGFKIVDMTEINGLTYFTSQNLYAGG